MDEFESVKEEIDTGGGDSDEEGSVGGAATGLFSSSSLMLPLREKIVDATVARNLPPPPWSWSQFYKRGIA
ncbi:hypothetical protein MKW98_016754 [Papaver atlanticum]|uniref:Uncharacterized protein n=1 Tax=Papaver atlanticum TaxID=357466 RepID=A0AAD4TK14_9MAGN|nr:hypothetical protein MKW98_016754 [Papaver atlanticum]